MTYTSSPNTNDLQNAIIQLIKHFSEIRKIKVKGNDFIQKKIDQISEQSVEFRKFSEESKTDILKMRTYADDLIGFAECCEDNNTSNDELLELLEVLLSDSRLNKAKAKLLKNQLERISISFREIIREIAEYNEKITEKRNDLNGKIDTANKVRKDAVAFARGGLMTVGIGTMVAIAAAPLTGGASLVVVPIAKTVVGLGAVTIFGGTATTAVSTVVAGASSITSDVLNCELRNVGEQNSQILQEMRVCLENINKIAAQYESYWEKQIVEIGDIINKFDRNDRNGKRLMRPIAKAISARAKEILVNSENYSIAIQQTLNMI